MSDAERLAIDLGRLLATAQSVLRDNQDAITQLFRLTDAHTTHPQVAELAEAFGLMLLRAETRQFWVEELAEQALEARARLEKAHNDALTGLPNRVIFHDRLRQAISDARRHSEGLGILFIDLDRFKQVNDSLGHSAGDELLRQVAARLTGCLKRESDTLARLGGDEFAVILTRVDAQGAAVVAERMVEELCRPFMLDSDPAQIGCSVGISLFPRHGEDDLLLLKRADLAMFQVKEAGRNGFRLFNEHRPAPLDLLQGR
jgi:diguanylate cyclase (GGDEF)-like protein